MDALSLDDIACQFGTDKSTRSRLPPVDGEYSTARPEYGHGYTIYYQHYLGHLRSQPIRMLEIGVLDGKSLATWNEFYPNALIYGLDIDPACARFENDKTKLFIGSQADPVFLADICKKVPEGFDLIIDDGSHYVKHVIASFNGLFGHLKPGGTYVIEDIQVANWRDWGAVAWNRGMTMQQDPSGNDPDEMRRFLASVRGRDDVVELIVHLKKIGFVRKSGGLGNKGRPPWERGDRLEDLFPPPRKRTFLQKVAVRLLGPF